MMARHRPKELIYTFRSSDESLIDVRRVVRRACLDAGLDQKVSMAMQLAIEEACSNIIRHAYLLGEGTIHLVINIEKKKLVITLIDTGRSFEFNRDETPNLDKYVKTGRKGGLGLYLIRKVMDEVDYNQVEGENHLRMVKYLGKKKKIRHHVPSSSKSRLSFRTKFSLTAAMSIMLIIGGIFLYLNYRLNEDTRLAMYNQTLNSMEALAAGLADKMILHDELELATSVKNAAQQMDNIEFLTVVDTDGIIWADAHDQQLLLTKFEYPTGDTPPKSSEYVTYHDSAGQLMHLLSVPVEHLGKVQGAVLTAVSEKSLARAVQAEREGLIYVSLGALGVAFVIIYLIAHYYVRPVRKLSDSVTRIGESGKFEGELDVEGQDEISEIARAFNEMAKRFREQQKTVVQEERIRAEISTAQDIQQALLPKKFPDVPGYEIATIYRPSQNVSGDYFDFLKVDDRHLGIVVADVSGKGIPGSLVMTMLRTALRLETRNQLSPEHVLERVNSLISEDVRKGMFITAYYMILDIESRTVSFCSAGHNPMVLYRPSEGDCFLFNPPGIPLGMHLPREHSFGERMESGLLKLQYDDMLVVYTDGITESRDPDGNQFGERRLVEFIKENSGMHPREFVKKLENELSKFTGHRELEDDITLVVIKEKTEADVILLNKRKRLMQLVESGEMTVEQACQQEGISEEAFYRYYQKWKSEGEDGLVEILGVDNRDEPPMISYSHSEFLRRIVSDLPQLNAEGIYEKMKERLNGKNISIEAINAELKRLHLDTEARRIRFSLRTESDGIHDPGGLLIKGNDGLNREKIIEERKTRLKELLKEDSEHKIILDDNYDVRLIDRDELISNLLNLNRNFGDTEIARLSRRIIDLLAGMRSVSPDESNK
ncbi:MAG: SpoIIE family protein phosphatase [candidate division Zixibacteria bacterium]|nr:SpoIIE family protein phosphatase [candidate division Zixibacteria bacterium]